MAQRKRRKKKPRLLGSHQKCWLWGRHVVLETLSAGGWPVVALYLSDDLPRERAREAEALARELGTPVTREPAEKLERRCHAKDHQGYLAKMGEFPYRSADELLRPSDTPALYAVLDGLQDPHNLGAVVRSAEVFGLDGIFLARKGQVGVTAAVARSSAGAVNRLPIARVEDLVSLAGELRERGVFLTGASEKAGHIVTGHDFMRPTAIVIGSESEGIRPALRERCDALVRIPQRGRIGSLNAAAAAAILFYEARRQRDAASG